MKIIAKVLLAILVTATGCSRKEPRGWYGPQGDFESNMRQTGPYDVQQPLGDRKDWARQHGMPEPTR